MYALTDEALDSLMVLAAPLPPHARAAFVEAVLEEATKRGGEMGAGLLHRVGAEIQKTFATRMALAPQPAGATRQIARRR
jgi:hypothetical protein